MSIIDVALEFCAAVHSQKLFQWLLVAGGYWNVCRFGYLGDYLGDFMREHWKLSSEFNLIKATVCESSFDRRMASGEAEPSNFDHHLMSWKFMYSIQWSDGKAKTLEPRQVHLAAERRKRAMMQICPEGPYPHRTRNRSLTRWLLVRIWVESLYYNRKFSFLLVTMSPPIQIHGTRHTKSMSDVPSLNHP